MGQPSSESSRSSLAPNTRFGAYQILERLGAGGMGEVYRARDTRLGREVAIKTILAGGSSADAVQRFEQEARSASSLNHPNIITIYELGNIDGIHYIAMELLTGHTLRTVLSNGALPFHKVISVAAQVADALAKAHEIGVVHRDIKPENLILTSEGAAKIVDFGLAKLLAISQGPGEATSTVVGPYTQPGMIVGSVGYMSPEQANGQSLDFRTDQFSFGAVLFEMITGHAPFHRKTTAETLVAILRDEPERIGAMHLNVPAPFVWVVERCLAKDPKDRYGSTRDLARDLVEVRDRAAAAPAPSLALQPSNLPVQRTPFIGREAEAAAVRESLLRDDVRLLTITGPGGIGKTRLALQVAADVSAAFSRRTYFVALSTIHDPALIVPSIAQAMGVREAPGQSLQDLLNENLRSSREPLLLLLDNFEHLVAAAPLIAELISASETLKVIVTSRSPLHLYGEHEFPVPPLGLPATAKVPPLKALAKLSAIELFVERAQCVNPAFTLTDDNATAVASICTRLDGLPLAIELAAARVKMLSPAAMQARLESSLNFLTGGARDLPSRQQTLRGAFDWSYSLLTEAEQKLFRRLAVFAGGCTFEGVEAVCDTSGDLGLDVLDGMTSMLDKSLVRQVNTDDEEPRFVMLSTIREYALERLKESVDEKAARRAHAAYCIVLAEEGTAADADQSQWLARFELEHDNFRAALHYLVSSGDAEWGLRLGSALFRFWETAEYFSEGRDYLANLLALPGAKQSKLQARALFAAGVLAGGQGDYTAANKMMEASFEASRAANDERGVAVALNAMAVHSRERAELSAAAALFEESLVVWRKLNDQVATARGLSNLANVMKLQGEFARATSLYNECLAIFRTLGDDAGAAWSLNYKGDVAREQREWQNARALYEEALAAFRSMGDSWGVASVLSDLATLNRDQGLYPEARHFYAESLRTFQRLGHRRGMARVFESLAMAAVAQGDSEFALRFAGAAAALRKEVGAPLTSSEQETLERALAAARKSAADDAGLALWMKGWATPLEETVEEALRLQPPPSQRSALL